MSNWPRSDAKTYGVMTVGSVVVVCGWGGGGGRG